MVKVTRNYTLRSLNEFEIGLERYYSQEALEAIRNTVIGIAGCGGLGSNCAIMLARCGFRNFIIVDCDVVEPSNLNRQHYFIHQIGIPKVEALLEVLRRVNPDISVEFYHQRVNENNIQELFSDAHVLVEAFDSTIAKQMFYEAFHNDKRCRIMASGIAGFGHSDEIITRCLSYNCYIVGDETRDIKQEVPLAPRVTIAAAKQADIVLSYVLKNLD
jgi:sulfur carrier protein ThiS adenylyltransferase